MLTAKVIVVAPPSCFGVNEAARLVGGPGVAARRAAWRGAAPRAVALSAVRE